MNDNHIYYFDTNNDWVHKINNYNKRTGEIIYATKTWKCQNKKKGKKESIFGLLPC